MRKFIISLLFLLFFAGLIFFMGWAQLSVPPGAYGVIFSKTHGIDPEPVMSGEFRWVWYKLIPTNVEIPVFHLEPENWTINFNSTLPSGNSYALFASLNTDFSWELKALVSFNLKPEKLVQIVTDNSINNQEALLDYKHQIAQKIETIILRILSSGDINTERLESILAGGRDIEMEREINQLFPEIRDFTFIIQSAKFPDFILYKHVRLLYEDFLAKQREFIKSAMDLRAEAHIETRLRFNELELYGDLLTRFPVLLEFLEMENR
jgi:hypothetical protein